MTIHMQKVKVKVKDHSVQKLEWKRTDRRMDRGDCITSRTIMRSVISQSINQAFISGNKAHKHTLHTQQKFWKYSIVLGLP